MLLKNLLPKNSLFRVHPYNPPAYFLSFSVLLLSRFVPVVNSQTNTLDRWKFQFFAILISIVPSGLFAFYFLLLKKFGPEVTTKSKTRYLSEILVSVILIFISFHLVEFIAVPKEFELDKYFPEPRVGNILFTLLCVLFLGSWLDKPREISENALRVIQNLNQKLLHSQKQLVLADDEFRIEISQFLHNRVQSDLMISALKLERVRKDVSKDIAILLKEVSDDLERIRTTDLRSIINSLGPNLDASKLSDEISLLLKNYSEYFEISLDSEAFDDIHDTMQKLSIYRIIEQALLNSMTHGSAKKIDFELLANETERILVISDDGIGVDLAKILPGMGSVIVDTWVSVLKGKKHIQSSPGQGYKLEVKFKIV